tara:strand:- start:1009 stop:1545 length:537 start_codon:yes stop_codon:yes gene_type:complete
MDTNSRLGAGSTGFDGPRLPSPAIPSGIGERLLMAQEGIGDIHKTSRNSYQGYDYASGEDIIRHCRVALHQHGLAAMRGGWFWTRWSVTADGEPVRFVCITMLVSCPETNETWQTSVDWPVVVSKGRPDDKALASALTDGTKYWFLGLLMVPRADVEMDMRNDHVPDPARGTEKGGRL